MLKSFSELRKVDVSPYIKKRDGADYISWATVVDLLHQNGAERVYFENLVNDNGSSLFMSEQTFTDNKGNTNRCYEVRVKITVDDDTFTYTYPVLNGINAVRDNLMNQNAVHKATQRALVKAIAIRYGLGFSLWAKDEIEDDTDDIYKHSIKAIEERTQILYTRLIRKGMTTNDIAQALNKTPDEVKVLFSFYPALDRFEQELIALLTK